MRFRTPGIPYSRATNIMWIASAYPRESSLVVGGTLESHRRINRVRASIRTTLHDTVSAARRRERATGWDTGWSKYSLHRQDEPRSLTTLSRRDLHRRSERREEPREVSDNEVVRGSVHATELDDLVRVREVL